MKPKVSAAALAPLQPSDIKSSPQVEGKLNFIQINQHDLDQLSKLEPIMEQYAEVITNRHYEMLQQIEQLNGKINEHSSVEQLSKTFVRYLKSIPHATLDEAYISNRKKIGEVHSRINLSPEWFTGSFMRIYEALVPAIVQTFGHRPQELNDILMALIRILTFDSQIVLESYQTDHEFKIVDSSNSVMEIMMGIDQVKNVMDSSSQTVDEAEAVSAASEQLTASIQEVASSAVAVAENTEGTIHNANKGRETVESSLTGFVQMAADFDSARATIETLIQELDNMKDVVNFIKNVAGQTNLLALNASIEAARAGEHGRGFAVVADEVRKLAEETTSSVEKITETMQNITADASKVSEQTSVMNHQLNDRVGQAKASIEVLSEIISQIEQIGDETGNIAAIAEQQSAATEDITGRIRGVLEHSEKIRNEVEIMGRAVYEASLETEKARKASIASLPHLKDLHVLRISKTDHLLWKWWLYNYELGFHTIDKSSLSNHHQCRFGKWYDDMKSNSHVNKLPGFANIAAPHQKVHEAAAAIYDGTRVGDKEAVRQHFQKLEDASKEVLTHIDTIYAGMTKPKHH